MSDKQIKCVIVDDEPDSIGVLRHLLSQYCPEVTVVTSFDDSIQAIAYLSKVKPDILFLDIEMPQLNGFQLLEKIGVTGYKTVIISAYDQFGIKAVKSNIFDYVLKPIDPVELIEVIRRYKDSTHSKEEEKIHIIMDKLMIPEGNDIRFLPIEDIIRCESDNNYTYLYLSQDEKILVSKTLKVIEESLPSQSFIRLHNQHIINIAHIRRYSKTDGGYFEMSDGAIVPVSRYKKEQVLRQIGLK